jgi:hypothetical protein
MRTYILTMEDIKEIYKQGMRRGESEACAYDRGYSACGKEYDNLEEAMYDILNKGKNYEDNDYIKCDEIERLIGE